MKRHRSRLGLILFATLLMAAILVFFCSGIVIKYALTAVLADRLQSDVTIANVRIRWQGAEITGFRLRNENGIELQCERSVIRWRLADLFHKKLAITELQLENGRLTLSDVYPTPPAPTADSAKDAQSTPWRAEIHNVNLHNWELAYQPQGDSSVMPVPCRLTDIQCKIDHILAGEGYRLELTATGNVGRNDQIRALITVTQRGTLASGGQLLQADVEADCRVVSGMIDGVDLAGRHIRANVATQLNGAAITLERCEVLEQTTDGNGGSLRLQGTIGSGPELAALQIAAHLPANGLLATVLQHRSGRALPPTAELQYNGSMTVAGAPMTIASAGTATISGIRFDAPTNPTADAATYRFFAHYDAAYEPFTGWLQISAVDARLEADGADRLRIGVDQPLRCHVAEGILESLAPATVSVTADELDLRCLAALAGQGDAGQIRGGTVTAAMTARVHSDDQTCIVDGTLTLSGFAATVSSATITDVNAALQLHATLDNRQQTAVLDTFELRVDAGGKPWVESTLSATIDKKIDEIRWKLPMIRLHPALLQAVAQSRDIHGLERFDVADTAINGSGVIGRQQDRRELSFHHEFTCSGLKVRDHAAIPRETLLPTSSLQQSGRYTIQSGRLTFDRFTIALHDDDREIFALTSAPGAIINCVASSAPADESRAAIEFRARADRLPLSYLLAMTADADNSSVRSRFARTVIPEAAETKNASSDATTNSTHEMYRPSFPSDERGRSADSQAHILNHAMLNTDLAVYFSLEPTTVELRGEMELTLPAPDGQPDAGKPWLPLHVNVEPNIRLRSDNVIEFDQSRIVVTGNAEPLADIAVLGTVAHRDPTVMNLAITSMAPMDLSALSAATNQLLPQSTAQATDSAATAEPKPGDDSRTVTGAAPAAWPDATITLHFAELRYRDLSLRNLHTAMTCHDGVAEFQPTAFELADGTVRIPSLTVNFGATPLEFHGRLEAEGIDLPPIARALSSGKVPSFAGTLANLDATFAGQYAAAGSMADHVDATVHATVTGLTSGVLLESYRGVLSIVGIDTRALRADELRLDAAIRDRTLQLSALDLSNVNLRFHARGAVQLRSPWLPDLNLRIGYAGAGIEAAKKLKMRLTPGDNGFLYTDWIPIKLRSWAPTELLGQWLPTVAPALFELSEKEQAALSGVRALGGVLTNSKNAGEFLGGVLEFIGQQKKKDKQ